MSDLLKKNATILFQGDSITDCGRRDGNGANPMGRGYAYLASSWVLARYPELDLKFVNRGISGNRAKDLVGRWENDCIEIKPDILSVLIGVNDTWRRYDRNDATTTEDFFTAYHHILKQARDTIDPQMILCEPFVLPHPVDRKKWREDLDPKIAVVRELAREFNAILVPFDGVFAAASVRQKCEYWANDGVHPTPAGHALMAQSWIGHVLGE